MKAENFYYEYIIFSASRWQLHQRFTRVFCMKFWRQKFQSQMRKLEKSCSICFRTKNERVKC